jgi:hypothetical protein
MNGNNSTVVDWDNFLKNLAAELTGAAYPVALRHRVGDKWLDLELDLCDRRQLPLPMSDN